MLYVILLVLIAVVLGLGLAVTFGKLPMSKETERKVGFICLTAGLVLGLLAFILPRAREPDMVKRMREKQNKAA